MERAGITDPADVHYVQTKTPLLTIHTIRDAKSRGHDGLDRAHPRVDGPLQRHAPASASPSRSARSRCRPTPTSCTTASLFSSVASCSLGRRARPGAGRRRRQHQGHRRPLPHRPLGHAGRARRRTASGTRSRTPGSTCRSARTPATSRAGSSTSSSSARSSQDGTVHGRRNAMLDDSDVHWHRQIKSAVGGVTARSPATRRSSCRCRPPTRAPTAAARSPRSSTSARATPPATAGPADPPDRKSNPSARPADRKSNPSASAGPHGPADSGRIALSIVVVSGRSGGCR